MDLPQGKERWIIVRPHACLLAAKEQMEKKTKKLQEKWEKKLWHLSVRSFSCEEDAESAWKQAIKGKPPSPCAVRPDTRIQANRKRVPLPRKSSGIWCRSFLSTSLKSKLR